MAKTPLQELADHGQSVWIDYLSRPFVQDGDLAELVDRGVVGVTSNPTIFQAAIAEGDALRRPDPRAGRERRERAEGDLPRARGGRHPRRLRRPAARLRRRATARTATSRSRSTRTSRTTPTARSTEAKRLAGLVDRENLFIKIPATKEGLPAIEETIAAGIPVNVTLIFSLERYREVAEAYVRGLQRLAESGGDVSQARLRGLVLRLPRGQRGRQAPRRDRRPRRAQGQARDRQREARLQGVLGDLLRRRVGGARRPRARPPSAACGRRPRPRTPSTATSSTSRS